MDFYGPNDPRTLADLRQELKLMPNVPHVTDVHPLGIGLGGNEDGSTDIIFCAHDDANDCSHHIILPLESLERQKGEFYDFTGIKNHIALLLAASYN